MGFRETTIKYIKDILRSKTIAEVIQVELQQAYLRKLEAETAAEFAHAAIQYNDERIARLEKRLAQHAEENNPERMERNFCARCGKRTKGIHTCTPPMEKSA
jgi:hypothetical protein